MPAIRESAGPPVRSDEPWGVEDLDLGAYLHRIGYRGSLLPDPATLFALHRRHVTSIPFENLDVILARPISLALGDVQAKLVGRRRGGYCYEHGLLFAAVLERIGFTVRRLLARVHPSGASTGPRTHMLSLADVDGSWWLADVGFGAGLLGPLPLRDGARAVQEGWMYRLDWRGQEWVLSSSQGGLETALHAFSSEPQQPVDFANANHFTQTAPGSPFRTSPVAIVNQIRRRLRLHGLTLTVETPDGTSQTRRITTGERRAALNDTFGLELTADELAALDRFSQRENR